MTTAPVKLLWHPWRLSPTSLGQLIARAHGLDPAVLRGGKGDASRPKDCRLDSSRAAALLRTRLRGVREVLGRCGSCSRREMHA